MSRRRIATWWKTVVAAAAGGLGAFFAFTAHAQVDLGINYATAIGLGTQDIRTTISRIISYFLGFLGLVAVILVLYAGFLWLTAAGKEEQVSKAKRLLVNAIVGLAIILSSYAIARFVLRAAGGGELATGSCAPGQVCSSGGGGGLGGGATAGFRITGIVPTGAGQNQAGWPKNFAITIGFNATLNAPSVDDQSLQVKRCNPRVNGAGVAQAFDFSACTTTVAGTRTVDGSKIVFKPSATPGDEPTDFEGDFWYYVLARGGAIRDARNRALLCPFRGAGAAGDPSSSQVQRDLCERAIAFNTLRDTQPPTVNIAVPHSPPGYCAQRIKVQATANDDTLVSEVSLQLNGGTVGLVDEGGNPISTAVNADGTNPFVVDGIYIDAGVIAAGETATVTAVAKDGVPQSSAPASSFASLNPPNCCNGVKDPTEDGIDCGVNSGCGSCSGGSCTDNAQCASGFCNASGTCEDRPIIDDVSPAAGAVGTLVTIKGRSFGGSVGRIVFLGGDTDGDGNPKGDADDVSSTSCAPSAWTSTQVVVAVPQNAQSGPIELSTAAGQSDRTDQDPGWRGNFTLNDQVRPGICFLEPGAGPSGTTIVIHGSGFGDQKGESVALFNGQPTDIAQGGWAGDTVRALAPSIADGVYPVRLRVGTAAAGVSTNSVDFSLTAPSDAAQLNISDIIPASGPPGTYVTIIGTGFGTRKGLVRFTFGSGATQDVATGEEPACAENWHTSYVVVKVPRTYDKTSNAPLSASDAGVSHAVSIVTSSGRQSNVVGFAVKTGTPGPGLCSISPDNGPAGKTVSIAGEGFGDRPGNATPTSLPRYTVEFFKGIAKHCLVNPSVSCTVLGEQCANAADGICVPDAVSANAYGSWTPSRVAVAVPGSKTDKASWPQSGPVFVIANNTLSSNAVPFTVRDCNEAGGDRSCPADAGKCCANGSCQVSCDVAPRASAYGWRLSTETLPTLPIVLERSVCDIQNGALQSPAPYKDSRDACRNAVIYAEFNKVLDGQQLLNVANFTLLECGVGDTPDCSGQRKVAFTLDPERGGAGVRITPTDLFARNTWYRVVVLSDVRDANAKKGLRDPQGQYLDGDYDGNQGGDYSWQFRVRDSDQACELANVIVNPSKYTVDHEDEPASVPAPPNAPPGTKVGFSSDLLAANCNLLQCRGNEYNVGWTLGDDPIAALRLRPDLLIPSGPASASGACLTRMAVTASKETPPGSPATLTANASATGSAITRSGDSKVSVKFSDPVVVSFEPDCTEACVNARISATFNIPMDATSLTAAGNAQIFRCRNATCNPPFQADLGAGTVRTPQAVTIGGKTLRIEFTGTKLQPSSFYIVKLRGGDPNGVRSASGVPLTGLNDGGFFTWTFRTKDDGSPCSVDRASIEPASTALYFVGQRAELDATPFGAPDECNPRGQALTGGDYNWSWTQSENDALSRGAIGAFLKAAIPQSTLTGQLDTNAAPVNGCSEQCLNVGSQNRIPQCGNGVVERGEDCERNQFASGCSPTTCTYQGVAAAPTGTCGNGVIDAGEECEAIGGAFPKGCKDPAVHADGWADGLGCVRLGAKIGGSQCGDGFVGDGEDCDDRNKLNGDGCSADCIDEGTLPSCAGLDPAAGQQCINFCGNGVTEPGEDVGCDTPAGIALGCSNVTCLRVGSDTCTSSGGTNCCGNGRFDAGEECEAVDANGNVAPGGTLPASCTNRCLRRGSSAAYANPSFCRDGILGEGEDPRCDGPSVTAPDSLIDNVQVPVAGYLQSTDVVTRADGSRGADAVVTAATPDIGSDDKKGKANVSLACTCREQADPQGYCANIGASQSPALALGCSNGGCCAPAPQLLQPTFPVDGSEQACRNTVVRLTFDSPIAAASAQAHVIVGEGAQGGSCGNVCSTDLHTACDPRSNATEIETLCGKGATCVARRQIVLAPTTAHAPTTAQPGTLQRIWGGVTNFFRSLFGSAVSAGVPTNPPLTYCAVPGNAAVANNLVTWSPSFAFKANTWVRVFIEGGENGLLGTNDVPLLASQNIYFETGTEICRMDRVILLPPSHLFTTAEDLGPEGTAGDLADGDQVFTARAHPAGRPDDAQIASTPDYAFKWNWALTLPTSPIVVAPKTLPAARNGFCEDGEDPTAPDCSVNLAAAPSPKPPAGCGNDICEVGETAVACPRDCRATAGQGDMAEVSVRKGSQGFPKNGEDVVTVAADISERSGIAKSRLESTADVVVMLCENPWPARRTCSPAGKTSVPWDATNVDGTPKTLDCAAGQPAWYPFYDPATQVSFYYCRDGQKQGDEGDILPALKEDVVRVVPGRDIIREYLFTFAAAATPQAGSSDAIGFRIAKNPDHLGIRDWYDAHGFRGNPQAGTIDGYASLQEGRTTYVATAAKSGTSLFSNVDVFSFNDNATPETRAVFTQIIGNLNVNRNVKDRPFCVSETGSQVCVDAQGRVAPCTAAAQLLSCGSDRDCRVAQSDVSACTVDADGKTTCAVTSKKGEFVPERSRFSCADYKEKLSRDVRRIGDLQATRAALLAKKASGYPTLVSGSFLRGVSESAWPSWTGALSSDFGKALPQDPLNTFMNCSRVCTGSTSAQAVACTADADCAGVGGTCGFDPATCFSAKDVRYLCPTGSHVYEYRGTGGVDFRLGVDLEVNDAACASFATQPACDLQQGLCVWSAPTNTCRANVSWLPTSAGSAGATCISKDPASCASDPSCTFDGTSCQYKEGKVLIGGYTGGNLCQNAVVGDQGRCGDGVVQETEQCEPGMRQAVSCTAVDPISNATRTGSRDQVCTASCTWTDELRCSNANDRTCSANAECGAGNTCGTVCGIGRCGDGVRQPSSEACDDGPLNGSYGHCNSSCNGLAFYCGDGVKQPNEACDCRTANGSYVFNGVLQRAGGTCGGTQGITGVTGFAIPQVGPPQIGPSLPSFGSPSGFSIQSSAAVNSCAFDCSGPAPRCGDGIVNGAEKCDGGFEEFKGFCDNDPRQTGCNDNNQCNFGRCVSGRCANNGDISCSRDADCAKSCGSICPRSEQLRRRVCNTNDAGLTSDDANACKWSQWVCTAPGDCGNGHVDQGEECDDGNTDNTDGCVIDRVSGVLCKKPVCGDGFASQTAGEECDDASKNGTPCVPGYGGTCNFCSGSCKVATVSGGYCGNNVLEGPSTTPSGPEQCEGTQGIAGYICVSTRPEDQSKGKKTADSFCAANGCQRACNADSVVCANSVQSQQSSGGSSATDTDGDGIINACDPDDDNDNVPSQFDCDERDAAIHGEYKYTVDSPGTCTGSPPGQPISCTRDNDCASIGRGTCTGQNKCGPGSTTATGPVCDVAAAVEQCDGKDNDCDGKTDNVYQLRGKIVDAQSNSGIPGLKVNALCNSTGSKIAGTATTDGSGNYALDAIDDGTCDRTFRISLPSDDNKVQSSNGVYCYDTVQRLTVQPTTTCRAFTVEQISITHAPDQGELRVVLKWGTTAAGAPGTLDMHGKDSTEREYSCSQSEYNGLPACDTAGVFGKCKTMRQFFCRKRSHAYWGALHQNEGVTMFLDNDDNDGQGPETMTITPTLFTTANPPVSAKYRVYVDWWSDRGDSQDCYNPPGQPNSCSPQNCSLPNHGGWCRPPDSIMKGRFTDPKAGAVVTVWDFQCNADVFKGVDAKGPNPGEFTCSNNTATRCNKNSDCSSGGFCQVTNRFWHVFDLTDNNANGVFGYINSNILESGTPNNPTPLLLVR